MKKEKTTLTKKERGFVWRYKNSYIHDICACYKDCSDNKWRAQYFILEDMKRSRGYGYKVMSYNCMCFTCAYITKRGSKEYLNVFTKDNYYKIDLSLQ